MSEEKTTTEVPFDPAATPPAQACVVQIYGGELGKRFPIEDEVTIGRGESNTVVLDLPNVSRYHARLYSDHGTCYAEDRGSTNGTYVNDLEISGPQELANGDLVTTGGAVFKFIAGGNIESLYHEEIYRLTILDGLTGVHNKRYLLEFLERELARTLRHRRPLSLAMVDLDHFKSLNDSYGHLAGDHTLKRVAQLMAEQMRREELLARYGGEEFAIVLPETAGEGALAFCERIRERIAGQRTEFDGHQLAITVSIGVATTAGEIDREDFIRHADEALYRAKESGRNRVVLAG